MADAKKALIAATLSHGALEMETLGLFATSTSSSYRPEQLSTAAIHTQRFVFGFLIIHHFYQLPTSA
ncbi:hypothetical protein T492DRAFT_888667 [Pavlovales sp. CCMP2436]|nr:hypothetical protein T492DRAFT_888667 [Pavlovales sp. CCMP2436]